MASRGGFLLPGLPVGHSSHTCRPHSDLELPDGSYGGILADPPFRDFPQWSTLDRTALFGSQHGAGRCIRSTGCALDDFSAGAPMVANRCGAVALPGGTDRSPLLGILISGVQVRRGGRYPTVLPDNLEGSGVLAGQRKPKLLEKVSGSLVSPDLGKPRHCTARLRRRGLASRSSGGREPR